MTTPTDQKSMDSLTISTLTPQDRALFQRHIGLPGLPYPMTMVAQNDSGQHINKIGFIASASKGLKIYSPKSEQQVNGRFFRNMPMPSMMAIQRRLLQRMQPESRNCIMTVFGDPSTGKTFMFYDMAELVHPAGAVKVDCGGMNMRELFFRPVIDYGRGLREQISARFRSGEVKQTSVEIIRESFPKALVELTGGGFDIDWNEIGERNRDLNEDYDAATRRATAILNAVCLKEGIDVQANSFGIKMALGAIPQAWAQKRPIVLDEFTKCKASTLDSMQTFLQFLKGERGFDSVTIPNPMPVDSPDCPQFVRFDHDDRPLGWFVGISGNDKHDGETTHMLSQSMITRLTPMRVGKPELADWEHRLSQIYTGVPLSTLVSLLPAHANNKAVEFGNFLVKLRKLGLEDDAVLQIPPHQIRLLKNYQQTHKAIKKLASYYHTRAELADIESPLARSTDYERLSDELSSEENQQYLRVSFREAIEDFEQSLMTVPEVIDTADIDVDFDLERVFSSIAAYTPGEGDPAWLDLGRNLSQVIQESVMNATQGMPLTRESMMRILQDKGVTTPQQSGRRVNTQFECIENLLSCRSADDEELSLELREIQQAIAETLRVKYGNMIAGSDRDIIPNVSLKTAVEMIEQEATTEALVLPNIDGQSVTASPLKMAFAKTVQTADDAASLAAEGTLVDYRSFMSGLALSRYSDRNMSQLWLDNLDITPIDAQADGAGDDAADLPSVEDEKLMFDILAGKSDFGISLSIVEVADAEGRPAYISVLEDRLGKMVDSGGSSMMLMTDLDVPAEIQAQLVKAGVHVTSAGSAEFNDKMSEFLERGYTERTMSTGLTHETAIKISQALQSGYVLISGLDIDELPAGSTLSKLVEDQKKTGKAPAMYKRIAAPKAG